MLVHSQESPGERPLWARLGKEWSGSSQPMFCGHCFYHFPLAIVLPKWQGVACLFVQLIMGLVNVCQSECGAEGTLWPGREQSWCFQFRGAGSNPKGKSGGGLYLVFWGKHKGRQFQTVTAEEQHGALIKQVRSSYLVAVMVHCRGWLPWLCLEIFNPPPKHFSLIHTLSCSSSESQERLAITRLLAKAAGVVSGSPGNLWASLVTELVKNLPAMQATWFDP